MMNLTRNGEAPQNTQSAEWKQVLGTPATVRHVPRPDADTGANSESVEYGGGQSFDDVYTTALVDFVFESRNVGRHDGHMAAVRVTRNETGLPWVDGWTEGDEVLDRLLTAAMTELDRNRPPPLAASNFNPFSE